MCKKGHVPWNKGLAGKHDPRLAGDYWHKRDYEKTRIRKFNDVGWDCLVIWESEISQTSSKVEEWMKER